MLLFFLPACSDSGSSNPCTINYWVAMDGSDQTGGDADNPFRTIEHARDVIRAHGSRGMCTITVTIKGGEYQLDGPALLQKLPECRL